MGISDHEITVVAKKAADYSGRMIVIHAEALFLLEAGRFFWWFGTDGALVILSKSHVLIGIYRHTVEPFDRSFVATSIPSFALFNDSAVLAPRV